MDRDSLLIWHCRQLYSGPNWGVIIGSGWKCLRRSKCKVSKVLHCVQGGKLDFLRRINCCENKGWSTCRLSHSLMSSENKSGVCVCVCVCVRVYAGARAHTHTHTHTHKIFDKTFSKLQKVIIWVILNTVCYTSIGPILRIYIELGILMYSMPEKEILKWTDFIIMHEGKKKIICKVTPQITQPLSLKPSYICQKTPQKASIKS